MRLRFLLVFLAAVGLSAPASAITLEAAALTAEGLGRCGSSYNGTSFEPCSTTPGVQQDPETDGDPFSLGFGLMFDWYLLDPLTVTGATAPFTATQLGHFGAGRTGGVDIVPAIYEFDLVAREFKLTQGSETVSMMIVQHAHLEVGMFTDTLTVDPTGLFTFNFTTANDLQLTLGTCTVTAEGDPPCDILITVTELPPGPGGSQELPAPSGLSLFGAALACMMGVAVVNRRRKLLPAKIKG